MKVDKQVEGLETEVDTTKREFMKKFGKYAATAPVGMYMLMTPSMSSAVSSGSRIPRNNGWGNGDQRAPGYSLFNNKAENNIGRKIHKKFGKANPN